MLTRRSHGSTLLPLVLTAILAATALSAIAAFASPQQALGATTYFAKCDANLRAKPSTKSTREGVLNERGQMYAITTVTGGSWRVTCDGRTYSGDKWYRMSNVGGRSVQNLYGRTYVYAATALFKKAPLTKRYATCSYVALRKGTSTTSERVARLEEGDLVVTVAKFTAGSYSVTCGGRSVSGNTWFRITSIKGTSAKSRYGLTYVYAAAELLTTTAPPAPAPTPTPTPTTTTSNRLEGIDVSHWQGTIDWAKVSAAGKKFAYIKASEHTSFVDDKYQTNRSRAKSAGLKVGAYHFARPNIGTSDAYAEADHFIETADWASGELRPVLDLEDTGGLSSSALQTWVKAFVNRIYDRTGVRAVIYVSPSFWSTKMGNSSWFANNGYDVLWIAHWTTASSPSVPAENWGGRSWTFWQYTSDGSVPGISGRVDLDRYNGTDLSKVLIP
jgi:GH25 family lysozyme M1 (1,4-beta-N-acetylmuramidase)